MAFNLRFFAPKSINDLLNEYIRSDITTHRRQYKVFRIEHDVKKKSTDDLESLYIWLPKKIQIQLTI